MHVRAIVSMLLVVALSMIVRLLDRPDYCICKYRQGSREFFDDSGKGKRSASSTGFSPRGGRSPTGGSWVPTNCAKRRRSERSWWTRIVRIVLVFSCGLKSSGASGTARHTLAVLLASLT